MPAAVTHDPAYPGSTFPLRTGEAARQGVPQRFEDFSPLERSHFEEVFARLAGSTVGADGEPHLVAASTAHMCRVMNLALTPDDVNDALTRFGRPLPRAAAGAGAAAAGAADGTGAVFPATSPSAPTAVANGVDEMGITFGGIAALYDEYAPLQLAHVSQYMAFFNMLDAEESDYVSVADLRHAICNLGDALTDNEFNHALYTHNLLHKQTLTVYEFMRFMMGVSTDDC